MAYKGVRVRYILAGTAVVSAAVGSAVTYVATSKTLEKKYADISETEIEQVKDKYKRLYMEDEYSDPKKMAEKYTDKEIEIETAVGVIDPEEIKKAAKAALVDYTQFSRVTTVTEEEAEVLDEITDQDHPPAADQTASIFDNPPEWNQVIEESKRAVNPLQPHVISQTEYFGHETGYEQVRVTYFTEDNTLADEKNQPIPEHEIIGDDNLQRFGHGSRDPHIVHVRNHEAEMEFEIVKVEGSFAEMVYGFPPEAGELKHSIRKFRPGRDE